MSQCFRVGLLAMGSVLCAQCAAGSSPGNSAPEGSSGGTTSSGSSGASGSGSSSGTGPGSSSGGGSGSQSSGGGSSGASGSGGGAGTSGSDASTGDDGGAAGDDGGSSGGGSNPGCGSTAYVRGPAPTSASASMAGPYQTMIYAANASVRMTDAYDVTSAHITYPVGATPPFTSIAVVPGFTAAESSIADWAPFLASWGIVTMTFGTSNPSTGASDTSVLPPVREAALMDALVTLQGENTRSGSPLAGKLDLSRQGVAGWSMGGGGTCLAANDHSSELKAVFAMEPWNTDTTYTTDATPTLIFAGTSDGLAGPPMPQDQYMSIPATTPKILYEITNGSHFVSTSPTNSTTDMAPDSLSTANVARFGLSWLKVYLECDTRFKQFLTVKPADSAEFDTNLPW